MKPYYTKHKLATVINIGKIVTIHYFEFDKHYKFEGERHDFWEMVYVDKGEIIVTARNEEFRLKQGEAVFHQPGKFHSLCSDHHVSPNVFIISFVCNSATMQFFKDKKTRIPPKLKHYIAAIIEEGKATFDLPFNDPDLRELKLRNDAPVGGQQLIRTNLEQLLIQLIRGEEEQKPNTFPLEETIKNQLVIDMLRMLNEAVYGSITVEELCHHLNYSKVYLSKLFKKYCGYTIGEYGMVLKIEEAKKLIRMGEYNFSQISEMLMFNNPYYFSHAFKRITTMSPREYANSIRSV